MNKSRLNTILNFLGVVVIGISLPITIYILKTGNLDLRISAFQSDVPANVVISDIQADSFKVSWLTERSVYGAVKLLNNDQPLTDTSNTNFHSLKISNLQVGHSYQFQLYSGSTLFDSIYTAQTHAVNINQPDAWIYGQVFDKDGISAQHGGIITITLRNADQTSQIMSAVINETGGYQFNLAGITNTNLVSFPFKQNTDIELTIYSNTTDTPVIKKFTLDLNFEKQIPNIYLGDINLQVIPGAPGN